MSVRLRDIVVQIFYGVLQAVQKNVWNVSGTIMPIIRSSRVIQMAAACGTWLFGLQIVGLVWSCGLRV